MANPQKENGYTPIANEILDQIIKCRLNGTQFRIVLAVWRYTYGFSRKAHSLSESFISKAIGVAPPHISREIKPLYENKILLKAQEAAFNKAAVIMFNKNYEEWQVLSNTVGVTELGNTTVTELGNKGITENGNQENNIKTNIKQNNMSETSSDESGIEKNVKTETINIDSYFEETYKDYPKKEGKKEGKQRYIQFLTKGREFKGFPKIRFNHAQMRVAIQEYVKSKAGTETQYFPMFSTFMNNDMFDYIENNREHFNECYAAAMLHRYGEKWREIKFKYTGMGIDK